MANFAQISKPSKLNLDKSSKYLNTDESFYLLNHDVNNPLALQKGTPLAANHVACEMDLPSGENYAPNNYYSPLTNENYTWHFNSNSVHFISRINEDGECQIVYENPCLQLSADPKAQITQWRAILDVDYFCNKVPGGKLKRLIWTDGTDSNLHSLDVEASIATNFFTTPFFDNCSEPCDYINLCVPEPSGCLTGEWVAFSDSDIGLSNKMIDKGFKFAWRYIYYDQRASELSDYSSLYYQDAKGCFDNSEGFSRCMKFRIPIGNPMVEKIEFYFSEDGGLTWFLADTIEKYKQYNSSQQYWYQRDLIESVSSSFSSEDCAFDYTFCNDKQRIPIDPKLLTRVLNPIPREVQGIFRIKDSIAAYNYVLGNCPIDRNEAEKFQIEMNCEDTNSCNIEMAKVTVRAIIYVDVLEDESIGGGGYIFRSGGGHGAIDDVTDPAWFGSGFFFLNQVFAEETRNFIAYIEGTNYWGEMEQWRSGPNFTSVQKIGVLAGLADDSTREWNKNDVMNGNFYYQEYIFTVPKGTKGFVRLASHHQTNGIGTNQNTSTQVVGMLGANGLHSYNGATQFPVGSLDYEVKEMYFDTCNGDFDNFDAFIVNDVTYGDETGYSGYLTDMNNLPVAGALIYNNTSDFVGATDHNGFFFFHAVGNIANVDVHVETSCFGPFTTIASFTIQSDSATHQMSEVDFEIPSEGYADDFFAEVDIVVKDCNDLPVRGVRVALSGDKYKITDTDGIAHFKVRNYESRDREIVAVVMDKGGCFTFDCTDGCNPCMPSTPSTLLAPCFVDTPDYTITMATKVNTANIFANRRSLKRGGRYPFAFVVEGDCGKLSAVNEIKYFDIPSVQETGGYSFCNFTYNGNGINLPAWAKRLKIVRGVNVNPYTLQWVVDSIDFTTDGKIILTIQSLNDYNTQFNFKTNTVYQYSVGDRVEFIKNGDGVIYNSGTNGILNYAILSPFNDEVISGVTNDVNYFNQIIIIDDGKLDGLEEGAIIEIQPSSVATQQVTYFSICATIPVINGQLEIPTGDFETFDTYLVSRQINGFPAQFFEHKSPSDFWGETTIEGIANFISDIGKAYFVNPYENEKRFERNFSINAPNQLNYFGDFIKTLDAVEQGGIIAVSVKDDKIGLALCENDNFLFEISDDLLRIGSDNIVRAAPTDSIISNPQAKIRGEYGVSYQDIGSILFGDGFAFFADGKNNSPIMHNYSFAQKCGLSVNQQTGLTETSCQSYFQKRMRQKANFNKTATNFLDHYRWSVGQNKTNSVIYLTLKSLRLSGVNNAKAVYELPNETIMYTPISDNFLGFASFTSEGYSQLELNTESGCAFLSYQNSLPYIHPVIADKWNTFYEVQCDWLIGVTLNQFVDKIKIPLSLELQSDKMFFSSKVTTDKLNFLSEVPPIRVKNGIPGKWNFAFLNDINSRGGLYNGSNARSYYTNILLIRDNTINLAYNTISNQKREEYSEVDSIITKFELVEQSGYTENL